MSSTYGGVQFKIRADGGWNVPFWEQAGNVTERHLPYSNQDDVQGAGRGNFRMAPLLSLTSSSDLAALQALVGTTQRTLVVEGTTYTGVMLINLAAHKRHARLGTNYYEIAATFVRSGT